MEETLYNLINNAFNIIIDEFRRCISTYRNILLKCKAIREKVKEHEDNYKLFKIRYITTNRLNSQAYNKKRICRCRSTI
jgi:hypothetical protein|nr:hypothetical protein [uncultured Intestinibacter sp.]